MGTVVDYATEKGVALITLRDPPVNAYTYEMMKELDAAILEARFDNDVHVLVITGHGERYFCPGANLEMMRASDASFRYYLGLYAAETLARLESTPKLSIAALNGHCFGGGLEIALAADLRIARRGPLQLGLPEIAMGLLPSAGGTARLTRLLGKGKAMELLIEGTALTTEQGEALGLVNRTLDAESTDGFVRQIIEYAHGFCPPGAAATAIGRLKRSAQVSEEMPLHAAVAFERELQASASGVADAREGMAAHAAKRSPNFRGR